MARLSTPKKVAFSAMMTLGIWLLTEAIVTQLYTAELRAWESPPPTQTKGLSVLQGNPYLIYEYPPGDHKERGVNVHVNSLGLRGAEIEIPKPAGVRRLITTGDSSVFGFGVQDDEVFSSVAAATLGEPVEAVCGAVPGYSTYQTLNLLRMRALRTEPDLFVIANIWSDNNFDAFVDKEVLATYAGYEESLGGKLQRVLNNSAIFRVADWKLRVRSRARDMKKVGWMMDSGEHLGLRRVEINDYATNLEMLTQIALNRGAEVVYVVLANNEDMGSQGNHTADKAWDPYRDVMRDTAARHGAPILDIPELFQASGMTRQQLFLDEMHPTAAGHALMGKALADVLSAANWPAGGSVLGAPTSDAAGPYIDPFVVGTAANREGTGGTTAGSGSIRIDGTVKADLYESGWIQIDAIVPGDGGQTVLQSIKIQGPGPFVLPVGAARQVVLRAYMDADADGPDADDALIDLSAHLIDLENGPASRVLVDLDNVTVEVGAAPPTMPPPGNAAP